MTSFRGVKGPGPGQSDLRPLNGVRRRWSGGGAGCIMTTLAVHVSPHFSGLPRVALERSTEGTKDAGHVSDTVEMPFFGQHASSIVALRNS